MHRLRMLHNDARFPGDKIPGGDVLTDCLLATLHIGGHARYLHSPNPKRELNTFHHLIHHPANTLSMEPHHILLHNILPYNLQLLLLMLILHLAPQHFFLLDQTFNSMR